MNWFRKPKEKAKNLSPEDLRQMIAERKQADAEENERRRESEVNDVVLYILKRIQKREFEVVEDTILITFRSGRNISAPRFSNDLDCKACSDLILAHGYTDCQISLRAYDPDAPLKVAITP